MDLPDDHELLRRYCQDGSQAAFAEVVERHVNLVYAAACRLVSDPHLAEDVTQQVFTLLARKAGGLSSSIVIPGWLYRATRNLASEALRHERRRHRREQLAVETMNLADAPQPSWKEIEPLLDDAMASLRPIDHDAVVLRYFENKSLKEVGATLGWSEDAAQKRVARALVQLRAVLHRRGVTVSTAVLATTVSGAAVQVAPSGLAGSIAAASLLSAASSGFASKLIAYMATIKLKSIAVTVILGALAVTSLIIGHQNARLRHELELARASAAGADELSKETENSKSQGVSSEELRRLRLEHLEVLSLRGRVTQLANELRQRKDGGSSPNLPADSAASAGDSILFTAALTNRVSDGHTLVVGGWFMNGMRGYVLATPLIQRANPSSGEPELGVQSQVVGAPDSFWEQIGWGAAKSDARRSTVAGLLTPDQTEALLQALKETTGAEVSNVSSATNRSGSQMGFGFSVDDGQDPGAMMGIDLVPRLTSDGKAVDLELSPSAVSLNTVHSSLKPRSATTPPRPH
jgi:RNA polymerase sigma factor (sigma-70 family)